MCPHLDSAAAWRRERVAGSDAGSRGGHQCVVFRTGGFSRIRRDAIDHLQEIATLTSHRREHNDELDDPNPDA